MELQQQGAADREPPLGSKWQQKELTGPSEEKACPI
jgi:hypothetical protein